MRHCHYSVSLLIRTVVTKLSDEKLRRSGIVSSPCMTQRGNALKCSEWSNFNRDKTERKYEGNIMMNLWFVGMREDGNRCGNMRIARNRMTTPATCRVVWRTLVRGVCLKFQSLPVTIRTTRFNIQKFCMMIAFAFMFCVALRTNSNFCLIHH